MLPDSKVHSILFPMPSRVSGTWSMFKKYLSEYKRINKWETLLAVNTKYNLLSSFLLSK